VRAGVQLRVLDRLNLDFALEPGAVNQKIEVIGKTPLLETASTNQGQMISNSDILELPIAHGSVMELFFLGLGTSSNSGTVMENLDPSRPGDSGDILFDGAPAGYVEYMLDGVPNTQTANSGNAQSMSDQPPADSLQEVKMETTYDAAMGHTSGSDVAMVLKSGTNRLHGALYFFYRNPALNANTFFANMAGEPKIRNSYQRGGGTIGGPIVIPKIYNGRDRTFFTYSYEVMNDFEETYPLLTTVPTQAERQGDFSALLAVGSQYQIYDPATIAPAAGGRYSRQPFANNIIPASRISPIATNIESYWPNPNNPGTADGEENYSVATPDPNKYQNHLVRIDHLISDKQHMYLHFVKEYKKEGSYRNYFNNVASGFYADIAPMNFALDDTYTFGPHLVMDLRYGFVRHNLGQTLPSQGFNMATLGFPQTLLSQLTQRNPIAVGFPEMVVSGLQTMQQETPSYGVDYDHSWFADLYHPVGSHALKFGGDSRNYFKNLRSYTNGTPAFTFSTTYTNGPLDNSTASPDGIGQGLAALLLGQPTSGAYQISDSYAVKSTEYGAYLQDNWRVTLKFTWTMGLRYEYYGAMSDRFNRADRGFDPAAPLPIASQVVANYAAHPVSEIPANQFQVLGGILFAGVGNQPHTLFPNSTHNFMPRVGFAYHPLKNTVIRAGYGIYVLDNGIESKTGPYQPGYSQATNLIPTTNNGVTFVANLANPFPNGITQPTGNSLGVMTNVGLTNSFFDENLKTPYMQRWNYTVQQVLPGRVLLQVGYAGSRATRLRIARSPDGIPDQYLSTLPYRDTATLSTLSANVPNPFYPLLPGTNLSGTTVATSQLLYPFPQFTGLTTTTSQGWTTYNSLQFLAERRFENGFSFQFTYTKSKQMDALTYLNVLDPEPYKNISSNDRPNHTGLALVYSLPFGKGKALLANSPAVVRGVVGGWQTSILLNQWSGTPLTFGNVFFQGNIKAIPLPKGQRTVQEWFNVHAGFVTTSSAQPADHLFQGPNNIAQVRRDGVYTTDIAVHREIPLRGDRKVEIRMEALNAFNHPNFGAPNLTVTSSSFGTVTSEGTFTRIVQFGTYFNF
jgi:hypothetical protein